MSSTELTLKLSNYRLKLSQLDALIAGGSGTSFASLRADVVNAISAIENRLRAAETSSSASASAAVASIVVPAVKISTNASLGAGSSAGVVAAGTLRSAFAVGARVEVSTVGPMGAQIISPGVVRAVRTDGLFDVAFIGSCGPIGSATIIVPAALLKPLPQPTLAFLAGELRVGAAVLARYGDGNWYNAEVEAIFAAGSEARVKFQGYGNVETLPREYVQRLAAAEIPIVDSAAPATTAITSTVSSATTASSANISGGASIARSAFRVQGKDIGATEQTTAADAEGGASILDDTLLAGFIVPDTLKSLPSDTAEDTMRKKRRISALKIAFKQKKADEVANSAASSWQNFRADGKHSGIKRSR